MRTHYPRNSFQESSVDAFTVMISALIVVLAILVVIMMLRKRAQLEPIRN